VKKEANLEDEIAELKQNKTRIWFNFPTGTTGVIFIRLLDIFKPLIDVNRLANHIIDSILKEEEGEEQQFHTRFTCRFIPIQFMMKASNNLAEFNRLLEPAISNFVANKVQESREKGSARCRFSWCVEFKSRNN